jgi:F0F1-type ATP synthase assembly protein I
MEPSDIEKKSLEAHVELCAERYNHLELKLETLEEKLTAVGKMVREVRDNVAAMTEKRNDQLVGWGMAFIGTLIGIIGWLVVHYVIK